MRGVRPFRGHLIITLLAAVCTAGLATVVEAGSHTMEKVNIVVTGNAGNYVVRVNERGVGLCKTAKNPATAPRRPCWSTIRWVAHHIPNDHHLWIRWKAQGSSPGSSDCFASSEYKIVDNTPLDVPVEAGCVPTKAWLYSVELWEDDGDALVATVDPGVIIDP